jgi:glutamate formiminotransferase/formiminotetrahydrofolate cyclodeaminase
MIPGTLKSVKAIGWYIEEYGIAQISMNLTNLSVTPVHVAFDEVCRRAEARGLRVTGSELVGLIPLKAMLDAGRYFLKKQKRSLGVPDSELIRIAVLSLGLNDLYEFKPEEKIIEYVLAGKREKRLVDMTLEAFMNETASESPAPGGGSVSAYIGAVGAALGTMVANLSAHKRGWDDRWEEFSGWAVKGKEVQNELLHLVDEDTKAFNGIMEAFRMPKKSDTEKEERQKAIREATLRAIEVPYKVMETAYRALEVLDAMARKGNPNSVSDAGVGALAIRTAVEGAELNVRINAADMKEDPAVQELLGKAETLKRKTIRGCEEILMMVYKSL